MTDYILRDTLDGRILSEVQASKLPPERVVREDLTRVRELDAKVDQLAADLERLRGVHHALKVAHEGTEALLRQARASIAHVRVLHHPTPTPNSEHYYCDPDECDRGGEGELVDECDLCWGSWPCATIRALDGTEGDDRG